MTADSTIVKRINIIRKGIFSLLNSSSQFGTLLILRLNISSLVDIGLKESLIFLSLLQISLYYIHLANSINLILTKIFKLKVNQL